VLGLFDELDAARGVLEQLAGSPLDLDSIEIVSADLDLQARLSREFGLQRRRPAAAAGLAGAVAGGMTGFLLGSDLLSALGPLLSTAAGILAGGAGGVGSGLLAETVRIPSEHEEQVLAAVEAGAISVIVRTPNIPTARAIGDLFRAAGSRQLDAPTNGAGAIEVEAAGSRSERADAGTDLERPRREPRSASGARSPDAEGSPGEVDKSGEVPREGDADDTSGGRVARTATEARSGDESAETDGSAADRPEPVSGQEAIFAPPWRRGVTDARAAEPPPGESSSTRGRGASARTEAPPPTAAAGLSAEADIVALGLSSRFTRILHAEGILTVGELRDRFGSDGSGLAAVPGIGPRAIEEIREQLSSFGMTAPPLPEGNER